MACRGPELLDMDKFRPEPGGSTSEPACASKQPAHDQATKHRPACLRSCHDAGLTRTGGSIARAGAGGISRLAALPWRGRGSRGSCAGAATRSATAAPSRPWPSGGEVGDDCRRILGKAGQPRPGQPDDDQGATRHQELTERCQRGSGVHVVPRRDAGDHAERCGLERAGEEVAAHKPDLPVRALPAGQLDARGILVDAHHVRNAPGELPGQHPLPAGHVQHRLTARTARGRAAGAGSPADPVRLAGRRHGRAGQRLRHLVHLPEPDRRLAAPAVHRLGEFAGDRSRP